MVLHCSRYIFANKLVESSRKSPNSLLWLELRVLQFVFVYLVLEEKEKKISPYVILLTQVLVTSFNLCSFSFDWRKIFAQQQSNAKKAKKRRIQRASHVAVLQRSCKNRQVIRICTACILTSLALQSKHIIYI